jgi:phosphatidylinositol alpha 1,6-mannosyltransferase
VRLALFADTYLPQVNGVARSLAKLMEHAADRGHDVALVTPSIPKRCRPSAEDIHSNDGCGTPPLPRLSAPDFRLVTPRVAAPLHGSGSFRCDAATEPLGSP